MNLQHVIERALQGEVTATLEVAQYLDSSGASDLAQPWWQRAASAGDPTAMWRYGIALIQANSFDEGLQLVLNAAEVSEAAMGIAADLMADIGDSTRRDEFIMRAAERGARSDWEEDFANGEDLAGLRLIRLDALGAAESGYVETVMALGEAWVNPDEFMLHRTAIALRSCSAAPWGVGDAANEIAYLALTLARELELEDPELAAFRQRVVESTSAAFSSREAQIVTRAFEEALFN